jgi:hypothetical protein
MSEIFSPGSIAGPAGPPATFLGPYDAGTSYSIGQAVSSGGSSYVSLVNANVGHTPASSPAQWGLLAAAGADGASLLSSNSGPRTVTDGPATVGTTSMYFADSNGNVPAFFDNATGDLVVNRLRELTPESFTMPAADIVIYLVTGQSLAVGYTQTSLGLFTTVQRFQNLMLNGGVRAGQGLGGAISPGAMTSLVPLIATADSDGAGDGYQFADTIANGFADTLAMLAAARGRKVQIAMAVAGFSGQSYAAITKGTQTYANALAMVAAIKTLAAAESKTVAVGGVLIVHGEADQQNATAGYDTDMVTLQADYQTDLQAITGQAGTIPLLQSQISSAPNTLATAVRISDLQLNAAKLAPGLVYLYGPKYAYTYVDSYHLQPAGYTQLGEQLAHCEFARLTGGVPSIMPLNAVLLGKTVLVRLSVPTPPLVLDTTAVAPPTANPNGMDGWEFEDGSGSPPAITSWSWLDPVNGIAQIQLAFVPTGASPKIAFAETSGSAVSFYGGGSFGQRGNVRDSTAIPSLFNFSASYNWCPIFTLACD